VTAGGRYPFGAPVTPRPPSATTARSIFLLGAYPSALHVEWTPPEPWNRVRAIPVDDEPTPFWDGADEGERVAAWTQRIGFTEAWGSVRPVGALNGSSGVWVRDMVLAALGAIYADAWASDCLDTYRASTGATRRLDDTYAPFARNVGLLEAQIGAHPSEDAIVDEALRLHRARLSAELSACGPALVVTLGNAALRVARELVDGGSEVPAKLSVHVYGARYGIGVAGRQAQLLPLAHPASPRPYQVAHQRWSSEEAGRRRA
jgi:hypothetical protein